MSTSPYLLPSGDPDWKKIDQRIIAERKKGTSINVLMQTFLLSKHKVRSRLRHLADAGMIAKGGCANRRMITPEERDVIVAEYATADTAELSARLKLSKHQLAVAATSYGIARRK